MKWTVACTLISFHRRRETEIFGWFHQISTVACRQALTNCRKSFFFFFAQMSLKFIYMRRGEGISWHLLSDVQQCRKSRQYIPRWLAGLLSPPLSHTLAQRSHLGWRPAGAASLFFLPFSPRSFVDSLKLVRSSFIYTRIKSPELEICCRCPYKHCCRPGFSHDPPPCFPRCWPGGGGSLSKHKTNGTHTRKKEEEEEEEIRFI